MLANFNKKTLALIGGGLLVLYAIVTGGGFDLSASEGAIATESVYVPRPSGNLDVVGRVVARHSNNNFEILILWSEDDSADFVGTSLQVRSTGHARLDGMEIGDIVELEGSFNGLSTGNAPQGFLTVASDSGFGFLPASWSAD